ncbi:MAG TPA: hypothetical protein VEX69_10365, partial [Candidatus Limnocylindria bacterium]|nr:hypothetical protein [Candidatus Limnocylindria bacterium]
MNRTRSPLIRYLAIAAGVLALATSNLIAQALFPAPIAQKQTQPHKRPDESNPFHVQFRDVTREAGIHF